MSSNAIFLWLAASASMMHFVGAVTLNSTCETDGQTCGEDPQCATILSQYLLDCEAIFAVSDGTNAFTWQEGWCPSACQDSLRAYLEHVYPELTSTDFCDCGSADCDTKKQQLFDQKCVAPDCGLQFGDCQGIPECEPLATAYLAACESVLGLTLPSGAPGYAYNFCPQDCQVALDAYLNSVAPGYSSLRFCDCNGEANCLQSKARLQGAGCATPDCQLQFGECQGNADCAPQGTAYLAACGSVLGLDGSISSSFCPSACQSAFNAYLDFVSPDSTSLSACSCSMDPNCEAGKNALVNAGCVAKDCTQLWLECNEDVECEPIATEYFAECEMVFDGTWTADFCPTSCVDALETYVQTAISELGFSNPLDYCSCNGDAECEAGFERLLNAKCLTPSCDKLNAEHCETNPDCVTALEVYLTTCESVLNGTIDYCPSDCAYQLSQYLPFITDRVEPPICSCAPGSDCEVYSDRIISAGCLKQGCDQLWYNCQQDAECAPIAAAYLTACDGVLAVGSSITECPSACSEALGNYISAASLFDTYDAADGTFCDCDEGSDCDAIQAHIIEIGCIPKNCEFEFGICEADAECGPIATAYVAACSPVFEGAMAEETQCTAECMHTFQAYIAQVYGTQEESVADYCECSATSEGCVPVQAELDRLNCNDPDDCSLRDYQCSMDSACAVIRDNYFAACQIFVNGTYFDAGMSYDSCPAECAAALRAYVEQVYGGVVQDQLMSGYCNCNAGTEITECTQITAAFDALQCLAEDSTTTTTTTGNDPGTGASVASTVVVRAAMVVVAFAACNILF